VERAQPTRPNGESALQRARGVAREIGAPGREEIVAALLQLGVSADAMRRALKRGRLEDAIFDAVLDPDRERRTVTAADIERAGGLRAEEIADIVQAWGFPAGPAGEPSFTDEEATVLIELGKLRDIWPPNVVLQVTRVYGEALGRIARAEAQAFLEHVERRFPAAGPDPLAGLGAVRQALRQLLPLTDPLLCGVHRRWVEHELSHATVREAELLAPEGSVPGAVDVALLFCDLKDFTAYADVHGDAAAVEAVERFGKLVARARGQHGHIVKGLGDGYMLVYPDPGSAVAAGARMLLEAADIDVPDVHASVHCGPAVAREGDYFGRSVNLAARLLALAAGNHLLATRTVVDATAGDFSWEHRGARRIRGFAEPVDVYRLESLVRLGHI
jgi:adenylate cyclase